MTPDTRTRRLWMTVFLVVAIALATSRLHVFHRSGNLTPVALRRSAAAMAFPQLGGGEWTAAGHRGQVVLINYWATWCEPCREELPGLLQLARESGPANLAIVGVSLDTGSDRQPRVQQFVTRYRLPYAIAFPAPPDPAEAPIRMIPTTILLDRQGRIAKTYSGAVEREDFAKDIATLLAEN